FLPRLEETRVDDSLRHLLHAEDQDRFAFAGANRLQAESQGRAAAGAAGFDVDDRRTGQSEARQHAVTRGDSRVYGAATGRLEAARRDTSGGERRPHRLAPDDDERRLLE